MPKAGDMGKRRRGDGRIDFLRIEWADKVQERLPLQGRMPIEERAARSRTGAFDILARMDPSPRKVHLQPILRWFAAGDLRLEDARRTRDLLERFLAAKPRLATKDRDINRFCRWGDLQEVLDELDGKRIEDPMAFFSVPESVRSETRVVAVGTDWMLVELLGTDASAHFASGTAWCTRHPKTCEGYLRRGPLFVAIWSGGRIQFHVPEAQDGQMCDERDRFPLPHVFASIPSALRSGMIGCIVWALSAERKSAPVRIRDGIERMVHGLNGWERPGKNDDADSYLIPPPDAEVVGWKVKDGGVRFHGTGSEGVRVEVDGAAFLRDERRRELLEWIARTNVISGAVLLRLGPDSPAFVHAIERDETLTSCFEALVAAGADGPARFEIAASRAWLANLEGERVRRAAVAFPTRFANLLIDIGPEGAIPDLLVLACSDDAFFDAWREIGSSLTFLKRCMTRPETCHPGVVDIFARQIERQSELLSGYFGKTPYKLALTLSRLGTSPFRDRLAPVVMPLAAVGREETERMRRLGGADMTTRGWAKFDGGLERTMAAFRQYAESDRVWEADFGSATRLKAISAMLLCDASDPVPADSPDMDLIASLAPAGTVAAAHGVEADARAGFVRTRESGVARADVVAALGGFRTGHVIAGLAVAERDRGLFETAIELKRGGALAALPTGIADVGLVAELARCGEVETMVDVECATPEFLEIVLEAMATDEGVRDRLMEFADNLAAYAWLRRTGLVPPDALRGDGVPDPFDRVARGLAAGVPFERVFLPGIADGSIPFRSVAAIVKKAVLFSAGVTKRLPEGWILARAPMATVPEFESAFVPPPPPAERPAGIQAAVLRFLGFGR